MSVVIGHPSATILRSILTSSLVSYTGADNFISSANRAYSDIDIGPLTIIGSFAIVFFLGRPFDTAIAFLLKVIEYSTKLIPKLETDGASEDNVDDRLPDHDLATTNCLGLWR
jgi:hypothetical protein